MMVSCIAVYYIQVLNFIKMMFGSIGSIDAAYTRVETATEDSCQAGFFKTFFVCPLPTIFKVSDIFRLIIGCIQIIYSTFQTGFHDSKILIGKSHVYDNFRFETIEECHQLCLLYTSPSPRD